MKKRHIKRTTKHIVTVSTLSVLILTSTFAQVQAPTAPVEKTIFVSDPEDAQDVMTSEDIYMSGRDIDFDIKQALESLKDLDGGVEDIAQELTELQEKYDSSDRNFQLTKREVLSVIEDIRKTQDDIATSLRHITYFQRAIQTWVEEIKTLKETIRDTKAQIMSFSQTLYNIEQHMYDASGNLDELKILLRTQTHSADTLSQASLIQSLIEKMNTLLVSLQEEEKEQIQRIKTYNNYKDDALSAIQTYREKVQNLNQKKNYLADFLKLYQNEQIAIETELKNLFETRKEVDSQIAALIAGVQEQNYNTTFSMSERLTELESLDPYADLDPSHAFLWPILPIDNLGALHKDEAYKEEYWIEHRGIEVPSQQGNSCYAARDGIVYKVVDRAGISLNRFMLVHTDGYVSVYKYINEVFVKEGDIVRRWQIICRTWWEPGTRGAWFISRGPNLTFAVAKNGNYIDPLSVLDLSIIPNKQILPDRYHMQYLQDVYARPRELYKVEFMEWDSLDQRRQSFLDLYGVGIYRQSQFRKDAAEWTSIDVDVGLCIWFAESTLGRYLTTPNNIGNVGNNDRWDRVPFGSALWGARSIYNTLNNQFLGHYNTLLELSGYGNQSWKIYASSTYNRQNNITKCLSMIKWYLVPDDFPFRTWLNPYRRTSFETEQWEIQYSPEE